MQTKSEALQIIEKMQNIVDYMDECDLKGELDDEEIEGLAIIKEKIVEYKKIHKIDI